jgi:hypothetical protein
MDFANKIRIYSVCRNRANLWDSSYCSCETCVEDPTVVDIGPAGNSMLS